MLTLAYEMLKNKKLYPQIRTGPIVRPEWRPCIKTVHNKKVTSIHPTIESRKIKIFLTLICILGLSYHLVITTIEYFKYDMVTMTTIYSPDVFEPPAISMCISLKDFNQLPKNETESIKHIINKYSLDQLMNEYSGDLTNELQFYDSDDNYFNFYNKSEPENIYFQRKCLQYFYSNNKCIRVPTSIGLDIILNRTFTKSTEKYDRRLLEHNLDDILLIDFMLDIASSTNTSMETVNSIFVRIFFHEQSKIGHNRDSPFVRYYWEPTIGNSKGEPNVARMNYHQINTIYMKYPFKHNCIDYDHSSVSDISNIESRGDCQEKCYAIGIYKKYGKIGRVLSTAIFDKYVPYDSPIFDSDIDSQCMKLCRVGCKTVQYNPMLGFLWTHYYRPHVFRIQLLSSYPQTFISFSEKFDILSYLIYMGGIFGMWVGLDLLKTTSTVVDYITKIFEKFMSAKKD